MDHFLLPAEEYQRDMDILSTYINDNAMHLHLQTGQPLEVCAAFVKRKISRDGDHPIQNPKTTIIDKDENEDRRVRQVGYLQYIGNIARKDLIVAPSMTTYLQPTVRQSELGQYIKGNLSLRSTAKGEYMDASVRASNPNLTEQERESWSMIADIKNNEQTSHKIFNNGISGAQAIGSTPMYLPSAHSSLTSGCRSAVSYGNTTIERFVAGNRHYWSAETVKTNLISILRHSDYEAIERTLTRHQLRYPTHQEVLRAIQRSTDLYWRNEAAWEEIIELVIKLTPLQLAAFHYTGDFYHLRECNPEFAKTLLLRLSATPTDPHPDPLASIKKMKGDYNALVLILNADITRGLKLGDVLKEGDPAKLSKLANTYDNILNTLDYYHDVITTFWITRNVPSNVSKTRDIVRRTVVGSDTDSCLFSVREWVHWANGRAQFDGECQATWHSVVFLTCQIITHTLACLSAAMGVRGEGVLKLAMKNEYAFPVFLLTGRAKHYSASKLAQEGNVFAKTKMEIKGVGFIDSNCPPEIIRESDGYLKYVIDSITESGQFSMRHVLSSMARTEQSVMDSIRAGEPRYLKTAYVKPADSYKKPMTSNYFSYEVWQKAFAHKYGDVPSLPYRGVRVSLELNNRTAILAWINGIEDERMRAGLMECYGSKTKVTSVILPVDVISRGAGIPEELLRITDVRRLTFNTVSCFYLVLESIGVVMINKNLTQLVSDIDFGPPEQITA